MYFDVEEPWHIRDVKDYGWKLSEVLERVNYGDGESYPGELIHATANFTIALNRLDLLRFKGQ